MAQTLATDTTRSVFYTNAPALYDRDDTETLDEQVGTLDEQAVRQISVVKKYATAQGQKYEHYLFRCLSEAQWHTLQQEKGMKPKKAAKNVGQTMSTPGETLETIARHDGEMPPTQSAVERLLQAVTATTAQAVSTCATKQQEAKAAAQRAQELAAELKAARGVAKAARQAAHDAKVAEQGAQRRHQDPVYVYSNSLLDQVPGLRTALYHGGEEAIVAVKRAISSGALGRPRVRASRARATDSGPRKEAVAVSAEERATMHRMYDDGSAVKAIAVALNRPRGTVRRVLRKYRAEQHA